MKRNSIEKVKEGKGGGCGVRFVLGNKGSPVWEDEIWTEAWTKRRGSI